MPEKKLTTKKVINSLTREDWDPLLRLIPGIDCTENFGELGGMDMNADGSVHLHYYIPADIVIQFQNVAYDLGIVIPFDWAGWKQGKIMHRDSTFDFDSVDVFTKCKLITALVSADGALIGAFESGLILRVLKSIAYQVHWFPDELTEAMHSEFNIGGECETRHRFFILINRFGGTKNRVEITKNLVSYNITEVQLNKNLKKYADRYES